MRILCAENSPVSFAGLSILLALEGYSDVFSATNYSQIKEKLATESIDLLISELRFADAELLDVACEIRESFPKSWSIRFRKTQPIWPELLLVSFSILS